MLWIEICVFRRKMLIDGIEEMLIDEHLEILSLHIITRKERMLFSEPNYVDVWIDPFSCVNFASLSFCQVKINRWCTPLNWSCLGCNSEWRIDPPSSPLPALGELCQTLTIMQPASVWPYTLLDLKEKFYWDERVCSPARRFSRVGSIDVKCVQTWYCAEPLYRSVLIYLSKLQIWCRKFPSLRVKYVCKDSSVIQCVHPSVTLLGISKWNESTHCAHQWNIVYWNCILLFCLCFNRLFLFIIFILFFICHNWPK